MPDSQDNIISQTLCVVPLRDLIIMPHRMRPLSLFVGRRKSVVALERAMTSSQKIVCVAQKQFNDENPSFENLYQIGTVCRVLLRYPLADGTVKIVLEGESRCEIKEFHDDGVALTADVNIITEAQVSVKEHETVCRVLLSAFENYVRLNQKIPPEFLLELAGLDDAGRLADTIAAYINMKLPDRQALLSTINVAERLEKLLALLEGELNLLEVDNRLREQVKKQIDKTQHEFYLNEQLKAIQKELHGGTENELTDLQKLEQRIKEAGMSAEAQEKSLTELKKLKAMPANSSEASVARNYLDWMLRLPWQKRSTIKRDLKAAEKILHADHYGLEKVKERILEYLAVTQRVKALKGPVLCLVGPPGVGKTSLGESIARATGREFVRLSLGGVRDEAEIRGHRRTYIGSMPGRILQKMAKTKVVNPLFLLDEVDKMTRDYHGDPSAALLEVLDPEQNNSFNDHYLDVDYDLSQVMFIATANSLDIPPPLLDRMEVIRLSGYTEDEKVHIAEQHLIPKQIKENGLKEKELKISISALRDMIRYYTQEAGVRNLEREIAKICRKIVKAAQLEKKSTQQRACLITPKNLEKYLGVHRYRHGLAENQNRVGQVTGLAWTEAGGDLLTIEVATVPGKSNVKRTGSLENVMLESIDAAVTVVRSRAAQLGLEDFYPNTDIHFHVPAGAIKKDGPSAGIAMCTALASSLTQIPVRADVAMTGEITLRGELLPIGGLKEKLLAALRGGIKLVIIPAENKRELSEIPEQIKQALDIRLVRWIDEVFALALESPPKAKVVLADAIVEALPAAAMAQTSKRNEKRKVH